MASAGRLPLKRIALVSLRIGASMPFSAHSPAKERVVS
jgi:hypothetical protein